MIRTDTISTGLARISRVEITPESVRLRKVELDKLKRQKAARSGTRVA